LDCSLSRFVCFDTGTDSPVNKERGIAIGLKNKVVVITGTSDCLGRQIAFGLAQKGSRLALISRDKRRLEEVEKKTRNDFAFRDRYD
jgi:FlaA1/EpsC-like NDP-sugar epimerase